MDAATEESKRETKRGRRQAVKARFQVAFGTRSTLPCLLIRGTTVIRTHDVHKKLNIKLYSFIIFGPDYYVPSY